MSDEREALEGQIADLLRAKNHSWAGPDKLAADIMDYVVAAGWRRSPVPMGDDPACMTVLVSGEPCQAAEDDLRRCTICGFVVALRYAATAPTAHLLHRASGACSPQPAEDAGLPPGAIVIEQADTLDGGTAQTYRLPDGSEHHRIVPPQPADPRVENLLSLQATTGGGQPDEAVVARAREFAGKHRTVPQPSWHRDFGKALGFARALLAEHARAEALTEASAADARLNVELQDMAIALKRRAEAAERERGHWRGEAAREKEVANELRNWRDTAVVSCAKRRCSTMQRDRDDAERGLEAAEAALAEAQKEIERLRDLLGRAGSQFRHYEMLHRQNGADDKAAVNEKWAMLCERAVTVQEATDGR